MKRTKPEQDEQGYILNEAWLGAMASALSDKFDVNVVKGDAWSANMRTRTITYDDSIKWLDKDGAVALLLHEIGHLLNSDPIIETAIQKKHPVTTHYVINMLEDCRIDWIMSRAFGNSAYYLDKLDEQGREVAENSLLEMEKDNSNEIRQLNGGLKDKKIRLDFLGHFIKEVEGHKDPSLHSDEYRLIHEKLKAKHGNIESEINFSGKIPTADIVNVLKEREKFFKNDVDYYSQRVEELNNLSESAKKRIKVKKIMISAFLKLKGLEPTTSMLKLDKELKDLTAEVYAVSKDVELYESTEKVQELFEVGVYPIIKHLLDEEKPPQNKQQELMQVGSQASQGQPDPLQQKVKGMTQKQHGRKARYNENTEPHHSYIEKYRKVRPTLNGFIAKYRRVLRDNAFDRLAGRFRTGKLTKKRIYKVGLNESKLFQRKTERKNKDYIVSISIDKSGSMHSDYKDHHSTEALVYLCEILHECDVPFEVNYFADYHVTVKSPDEILNREQLGYRASQATTGGGTNFIHPIKGMIETLKNHKSNNKIGIILTDGEASYSEIPEIKSLLEGFKKRHNGAMYAIGIQCHIDPNVFGVNSMNCGKPSQIMEAFNKILKKHITLE